MMQQTTTQAVDRTPALTSIPEARAYLGGLGATKLYALVNAGELVKVNIGRRGFITVKSLERYVDRLSA